MCEVVKTTALRLRTTILPQALIVVKGIGGSLIIHSVSGLAAGEKLGLEKFLQDTAVHVIRHSLTHEAQDRGRHVDQPGAFDLNSLPEEFAVSNQNTVAAMRSAPFRGRRQFTLNDFDRRFLVRSGRLGLVEKRLVSHQSRVRSGASSR